MLKTTIFVLLFAVVLITNSRAQQQEFTGTVVSVIDGRVIILETTEKARLPVQISHLDIPASEFPISLIVKSHLEKLISGKTVVVKNAHSIDGVNYGDVIADDFNIAVQLIRDGAAKYKPTSRSKQTYNERNDYWAQEVAARSESRGIWAIPGLVTVDEKSELEAKKQKQVKEEKEKRDEDERLAKAHLKRQENARLANERVQFWPDVPDAEGDGGQGLQRTQDRFTGITRLTTSKVSIDARSESTAANLTIKFTRAFGESRESIRIVVCQNTLETNPLMSLGATFNRDFWVVTEVKRISLNQDSGMYGEGRETCYTYGIGRQDMEAIAGSKRNEVRIGIWEGRFNSTHLAQMKQLLR